MSEPPNFSIHYSDVIMRVMASQITCVSIVCSIACTGANHSSMSLVFVRGSHRWPVNSLHKRPITLKMFPFDDIIMLWPYSRDEAALHAQWVLVARYHGGTGVAGQVEIDGTADAGGGCGLPPEVVSMELPLDLTLDLDRKVKVITRRFEWWQNVKYCSNRLEVLLVCNWLTL